MTVTRVCYCSRDDAQRSIDFRDGVDVNAALDRAMRSASENIEGHLHRWFYPTDAIRYFDWPNQGGSGGGQYANPWTLRFDQHDVIVLTDCSTGGVDIPLNQVFLEPVNKRADWPFIYLELDRSSTAAFGGNAQTPQHAIVLTGTFGFTAAADQVTTLAANVGSSDTTVTVASGANLGAGDLMILGYALGTAPYPSAAGYAGAVAPLLGERILVTDKTFTSTGLTQTGSGCETAVNSDNQLAFTGSGTLNAGEVVADAGEQMLVQSVTGSVATVLRGFNGTVLATHSGGFTIDANRLLSVARAQLGTSVGSGSAYSSGAGVWKHRVPGVVRDLCIAETTGRILQEGSGYARTVGEGEAAHPAPGIALADLWDEATTTYGRKLRHRAV